MRTLSVSAAALAIAMTTAPALADMDKDKQDKAGNPQTTERQQETGQNASQSGYGTGGASSAGENERQADQQAAPAAVGEGQELIGKELVGANNQEVGNVEDVLMTSDGTVQSVLVDVGGFLGIGGKMVAIPANNVEIRGDQVVAPELTQESAENMPEYEVRQG